MKLHKAVREFTNPTLAILQLNTNALLSPKPSIWEHLVAHFTNNIYEISFVVTTSYGDPAPFIGHNAFLRMSALEQCARYKHVYKEDSNTILLDNGVIYEQSNKREITQFFSEEHVSEDFEVSMRLQDAGFICRYMTHIESNRFLEGVSLNSIDEIIRLQKYAYGVSELIFHPINQWFRSGILSPTFKRYLLSSNISIQSKYNIIGYMGTYYAIAISPIAVVIHYFGYHYCSYWRDVILHAEYILYGCIGVFSVLTPIAIIILKFKLKLKPNIFKEIGCAIGFGLFFSGIGLHLLFALLSHILGLSMSWSSTNKESMTLYEYLKAIRKLWFVYLVSFAQLTMIGVGWFILELRAWPAIVPMALSAGCHIIVPLM